MGKIIFIVSVRIQLSMDIAKKSVWYQNKDDMHPDLRRQRLNHRSDVNLQYWPEIHNRSVEHRTLPPRISSQQVNSAHVDDNTHKNVFNKILRSSKEHKEVKIIFNLGERQTITNLSHDQNKAKSRHESPNDKNSGNIKIKPYQFKQPQWFKSRKKQAFDLKIPKIEQADKFEFIQHEIKTETSNNQTNKPRSGSGVFLALSSINTAKAYRDKTEQHHLHQSRFCLKKSKIEQFELTNIKLEEEIKELKYKLENLEEDNNILLGRIQTLEAQLNASGKKINQCAAREEFHRNNELKLKEKIQDLESKLLLAKDQINSKNQLFHDSGYNEGFSNILNNDKEVIQKKNEQISRLNQIINKTRTKVNQLNHLLGQQRINNLQIIRSLEQKYESMIQKNEKRIKELRRMVEFRRQKPVFGHPQTRQNTENPGLDKSPEQQINRVFSAHVIPKNFPFLKTNN